jgi:alpha-ketoglutarate-dependent taurine dioxygenase
MTKLLDRIAAMSLDKRALLEERLLRANRLRWRPTHIPRRPASDKPYLSFGQKQMWFLDQLTPGSSTYNIPDVVQVDGCLNVEALERAFCAILDRHEVLRTRVRTAEGQPVPVIAGHDFKLEVLDLRSVEDSRREGEARRLLQERARTPFDIADNLMLRTTLLRLNEQRYWLLILTHHIAWDVPSKAVLYRELSRSYQNFVSGKRPALPTLPIQYSDFAAWQQERLQGEIFERQAEYWKDQLGSAAHVLHLPTDRPRPAVAVVRGAKHFFSFPAALADKAAELSRQQNTTLFMTLLAGFAAFLRGLSGQNDISIGSPMAGRNYPELENLIGFFINTTVLRFDLRQDPSFRQLIGKARQVTLGAHAHSELPFDKLVEIVRPRRDPSRMALVQVNFRVQSSAAPRLEIPGLSIEPMFEFVDTGTSKFDLALELALDGSSDSFWEYKTDLFDKNTVVRFASDFEKVLTEAFTTPDVPISELKSLVELRKGPGNMENQPTAPKAKSLKDYKRKAVAVSPLDMIHTVTVGNKLPLVVTPAVESFDLAEWAANNREFINTKVLEHGAILFRGFHLETPADFERAAAGICSELYGEYGDLPRAGVAGKIYQSTPYPADKMILFHNESSHLSRWPQKINFFCAQPAEKGGATPVADCREVARRMDPQILRTFEEKGLMYVRNFSPGLDVSWQQFFHTTDRNEVESACRQACMTWEWVGKDSLRIAQRCQAVTRHPKTGEKVFFNQVQLHHVYCLDPAVRDSLLTLFRREELPRHVYYGDGSEIDDSVMEHVGQVYEQCAVRFDWQKGDMITVDNMLVCHARDPHVGARKICVAMGEMISAEEVVKLANAAALQ